MDLIESQNGKVTVLRIVGKIDTITSRTFEQKLMELIGQDHSLLVLDCSDMAYISSAGLRVLLLVGKQLQRVEGKLVISDLEDTIQEVFEVSGFASLFPIYQSSAEAIEAIK